RRYIWYRPHNLPNLNRISNEERQTASRWGDLCGIPPMVSWAEHFCPAGVPRAEMPVPRTPLWAGYFCPAARLEKYYFPRDSLTDDERGLWGLGAGRRSEPDQ